MSEAVCDSWEDAYTEEGQDFKSDGTDATSKASRKMKKKKSKKIIRFDTLTQTPFDAELRARNAQVTLEDNSRTPFPTAFTIAQPAVKILQRPKHESSLSAHTISTISNSGQPKTIKQREEDYARARLRILGSAVPNYEEPQAKSPIPPESSNNFASPLIRQPHGPTSNGFSAV